MRRRQVIEVTRISWLLFSLETSSAERRRRLEPDILFQSMVYNYFLLKESSINVQKTTNTAIFYYPVVNEIFKINTILHFVSEMTWTKHLIYPIKMCWHHVKLVFNCVSHCQDETQMQVVQ